MDRRPALLPGLALVGVLALAACSPRDPIEELADEVIDSGVLDGSDGSDAASSQDPTPQDAPATETPPVEDPRTYQVELVGNGEPGASDTSGVGDLEATVEADRICYRVTVAVDSPVTGLHLHEGPPGQEGEVLANLDAPVDGTIDSCTDIDADLAARIVADPSSFYINLHTQAHPMGALRAQLG